MKEDAVGICVLAAMTLAAYFIAMSVIGCAKQTHPCFSEDYNDCSRGPAQ